MSSMKGDETRNNIKAAACRLFATRGIDGVSVREIAAAADQRNSGAIHYYFRSKEALVSELVVDGAKIINDRRNAMLDALERQKSALTLRKVVDVLVRSSTDLEGNEDEDPTYLRFINWLQMNHRDLFLEALDNTWNTGYQRCLAHVRALLPDVPEPVLNQRLVFMGLYLNATLSAREAALDAAKGEHEFWNAPYTMDNLIDTVLALLEARSSVVTSKKISTNAK